MLFCLKKHFLKNFKNYLISQYLFTKKELFFNKIINITVSFSYKNFFLASFLLYTFNDNNKYNITIKKNKINCFIPIISFFYIFNNLIYSYLLNLTFFKKNTRKLMIIKFFIYNYIIYLISVFFKKKFYNFKTKYIKLDLKLLLTEDKYKFIQFIFNFFQIPLFVKLIK
jgi:hypothetical protein